jgi:hypothetical protein
VTTVRDPERPTDVATKAYVDSATSGAGAVASVFARTGAVVAAAGDYTIPFLVRTVTVAYAATVTPNADTTDVLNIGALTNNITVANPTGTPVDGQNLRVRFRQDGTGGWTSTFGANFAFGTDVTTALIPTTASAKYEMLFTWNATDSKWRATAIVRGF